MPERITPFPSIPKPANLAISLILSGVLGNALAQPVPAPTAGDLPCKEEADVVPTDTVNSGGGVDKEGYFPLFDGTFKGWFQSCKTIHSNGSNEGGVFRIGQADGKPAIYTSQRGSGTGGLMFTNKKFTNYEITFETWPDYKNDAGIFNRSNFQGRCYQTVLDYIGGAAVGGAWGEGGFPSRDFRPYQFVDNEQTIAIPGLGGGNELNNWTLITQKLKATSEPNLPCPATGCTANDWKQLWDFEGWMNIKVQFYGGHAANTGNLHMKSWFKKPSANVWVPVLQDTGFAFTAAAGYIGIQVHNGGRWSGQKGTWYRNIRWKPLDDKGVPIPQVQKPIPDVLVSPRAPRVRLTADADGITGSIDRAYRIEIADPRGRLLEGFSGKAGAIRHVFSTSARGVLLARILTEGSSETLRLARPRD